MLWGELYPSWNCNFQVVCIILENSCTSCKFLVCVDCFKEWFVQVIIRNSFHAWRSNTLDGRVSVMTALLSGRPGNRGSIPGVNPHCVWTGRGTHPACSVHAGGSYRRCNVTVLHLLLMLTMHGALSPPPLPTLCTSTEFSRVKYITWELWRILQSCGCYGVPSGIRSRLLGRIEREDRGTRIHRNVRNYLPVDTG